MHIHGLILRTSIIRASRTCGSRFFSTAPVLWRLWLEIVGIAGWSWYGMAGFSATLHFHLDFLMVTKSLFFKTYEENNNYQLYSTPFVLI